MHNQSFFFEYPTDARLELCWLDMISRDAIGDDCVKANQQDWCIADE